MKTVGPKDFYEVKRMNLLSDLDWVYASDFYLPLLGPIPFAVYRSLYEDESASNGNASIHETIFRKTQVSSGEFYHALECLEALALVKTYINEEQGIHYFVYALYAPKAPKAFFKDVLLLGTLKRYIGEGAVKKLRDKYRAPKVLPVFKDVSASFSEVYHPDFNDPIYGAANPDQELLGDKITLNTDFNLPSFLSNAEAYGIGKDSLSSDEKATIAKYGTLYSISPKMMAEIASHTYDYRAKFGERIDFSKVEQEALDTMQFPYLKGEQETSEVSGESNLANKIRMMDTFSPIRYLSALQNGTKPVQSDASIAVHLSQDLGLANGPTNALIEYALSTNDNVLSRAFCEKIAAAMLREGVKTARDAMDYLNRLRKKKSGTKRKQEYAKVAHETYEPVAKPKEVKDDDEDENLEDLDTLLKEFYGSKS